MGVEKAMVQVLDGDGCVVGWALQVVTVTPPIVVADDQSTRAEIRRLRDEIRELKRQIAVLRDKET